MKPGDCFRKPCGLTAPASVPGIAPRRPAVRWALIFFGAAMSMRACLVRRDHEKDVNGASRLDPEVPRNIRRDPEGGHRMITISAFKWVPDFARGQVRDLRVR